MNRVRVMLPTGKMVEESLAVGSTVGSLVSSKGYAFSNAIVNVNRMEATEDQKLGNGDLVSITLTDMKGAAEDEVVPAEIREKSYADIVNYGSGALKLGDSIMDQVLADELKQSQKAHKAVVSEIIQHLRASFGSVNEQVRVLEEALVDAKARREEAVYSLQQLTGVDNNIFAALAFLGLKDRAAEFCRRMGCSVPPADSAVWNTSQPE